MNYESKYWGLIYDQMMEGALSEWLEANRQFYSDKLADVSGPVLECACGTGLIFLNLLEQGRDIFGFDASNAMLDVLKQKAGKDVRLRVSQQRLESFGFDMKFEAIIIPTNSLSMLTSRDLQIASLERVRSHLAPGGQFLLDLRHWDRQLISQDADGFEGRWHEWIHPAGGTIRQRIIGKPHDFANQLLLDICQFEYGDDREEFEMSARWTFQEEFEDLLRIAGFTSWHVETISGNDYWQALVR